MVDLHKVVGYGVKIAFPNNILDYRGTKGEVNQLLTQHLPVFPDTYVEYSLLYETKTYLDSINYDDEYPSFFADCITYTGHNDVDGYIIFTPPVYFKKWHHRNNPIDVIEYAGQPDFVKILDEPINPYITWADPYTFETINIHHKIYQKMHQKMPVPGIAESVKIIATYFNIDWKTLKPMVAMYWY